MFVHRNVYMFCEKAPERGDGDGVIEFETRGWSPSSLILQELAEQIKEDVRNELLP